MVSSYLVHNVFERVGAVNSKAHEEKIGLWIAEWSESVIFFLASGIPQRKFDWFAGLWVRRDSNVIFKDSWNVFLENCQLMPLSN
jgi:hypothetical protein